MTKSDVREAVHMYLVTRGAGLTSYSYSYLKFSSHLRPHRAIFYTFFQIMQPDLEDYDMPSLTDGSKGEKYTECKMWKGYRRNAAAMSRYAFDVLMEVDLSLVESCPNATPLRKIRQVTVCHSFETERTVQLDAILVSRSSRCCC
jgi:hypothetical protein